MTNLPHETIGFPWYHEADYNALTGMFEDGPKLAPTFKQWLEIAEGLFQHLQESGVLLEKVYITPEKFPDWCRECGLRLDNASRNKFVSSVIASRNRNVQMS